MTTAERGWLFSLPQHHRAVLFSVIWTPGLLWMGSTVHVTDLIPTSLHTLGAAVLILLAVQITSRGWERPGVGLVQPTPDERRRMPVASTPV